MINKKLINIFLGFLLLLASFGTPYAFDGNITIQQDTNSNINSSISYLDNSMNNASGGGNNDDFINPVNFSYMKNNSIFCEEDLKNLPSYYDLRSLGRVTPVKDQDPLGTCWIFSSLGSLESCLLPGENYNFSENHIKNTLANSSPLGFDRTYAGGGDWLAVLAYLARYSGPVLASSDPYNTTSGISPPGLEPVKHVQEAVFIPPRNDSLNNQQLKAAVRKYGGLVCSMGIFSEYYNKNTSSYYYNGSENANHDICIVGWDDNYSKTNFKIIPPGDGAFIIRNSWGTSFGDGGYFYMSYFDTLLANQGTCAFMNAEPVTNYNNIYQYDPFGLVNITGFNSTTAWFSNIFTSNSNNLLAASSFYALMPNSTYNLYVYKNPLSGIPISGTLALNMSGLIDTPGYKTIKFDKFVPLTIGDLFSVVVKINTPGLNEPIGYEYPLINYCSQATANMGEGYISSDGIKWSDMTKIVANASVCLKAFTVKSADLVLSKISTNSILGNTGQLIIKLQNNGPDNASSVIVKEKLPDGLKFISYSSNFGIYNPESGIWNIGNISVGSLAILTINYLAQQTGSYTNIVTVESEIYNPSQKTIALTIQILSQNTDNSTNQVKEKTIPLKETGTPIIPSIISIILLIGGFLTFKRE